MIRLAPQQGKLILGQVKSPHIPPHCPYGGIPVGGENLDRCITVQRKVSMAEIFKD